MFSVEELVIGDISVTKTEEFKGIAVSCGAWLPIKEVQESRLISYLKEYRIKGYTIIGLEQSNTSIELGNSNIKLPSHSILLLGREREGIPVEMLAEIDICLEIPQFGVIRSLNVHVSAALALWELTKNNRKYLDYNDHYDSPI